MTLKRTFRPLAFVSLVAGLLLIAAVQAQAQHHGGGGGGGFGGMGGPREGMGGPRGGMGDRESIAPRLMRSGPELAPPGRWWDDNKTIKKLNLSSDQKSRMDGIFNANESTLSTGLANLQREELRLSTMSSQDLQDETKVFAAIDRVAQARTDLAKEWAHTQLQLRQQLTAKQLKTLENELADVR